MEMHVRFDTIEEMIDFCNRFATEGVSITSTPEQKKTEPKKKTESKKKTEPEKTQTSATEESTEESVDVTLDELRTLVQAKVKESKDNLPRIKEALTECGASTLSQDNPLQESKFAEFKKLLEAI